MKTQLLSIESVVSFCRAKPSGNNSYLGHCPAHDDENPSFSISTGTEDQVLVHCFSGCSQEAVLGALAPNKDLHCSARAVIAKAPAHVERETLLRVDRESFCITDEKSALGRTYLSLRGLDSPIDLDDVRFHPALRFTAEDKSKCDRPALLGRIRDERDELIGLQRIYLDDLGAKLDVASPKRVLGSMKGGSIRLGQPNDTLALAEGLETALAVRLATGMSTWAAVNASNLSAVVVPDAVNTVHIFADLDASETGEKEAEKAADRLRAQGRTVYIHLPPVVLKAKAKSVDWLDIYQQTGALEFTSSLDHLKTWRPPQKSENFDLISLEDLFVEPQEDLEWLWQDQLIVGGFSLVSAKPKVGKTTLVQALVAAIARGEPFLDRPTRKGRVIYLALEEKRSQIKSNFEKLFAQSQGRGAENVYIHPANAPENGLNKLSKITHRLRPVLVVVDTLFKLIQVGDGNDYASVNTALEPLANLARSTGAHLLAVHHNGKAEREGGDAILGSTSIFGAVDAAILLNKRCDSRTIMSTQRYGKDIEESVLGFDPITRNFTLGRHIDDHLATQAAEDLLEFLKEQKTPLTEEEIDASGIIKTRTSAKRKILRGLVESGAVKRSESGRRNDPFKYSANLVPSYIQEQETFDGTDGLTDSQAQGSRRAKK